MDAKKWSCILIITLVALLVFLAGTMYFLDPFLRYGKESPPLTYYAYNEMYSNPGIARHYEYDSVLVGTSMIESTSVDLCDELLGTDMIRLPYSGGTSYNMKTILDICFESPNEIRSVYWELDEFQLTNSAVEPRYPLPTYLYESQHRHDLSYLLNLDIFYHYVLKDVWYTLAGQIQPAERRGIELTGNFGRDVLLSTYSRPELSEKQTVFEGSSMQKALEANLKNIQTEVEAHPDTQFHFFLVPFSILYWDRELRNGTFDAAMDCLKQALKTLVAYDNVTVYFYQCEPEIITNLDNYKDYSHYGSWINDTLTRFMAERKNIVTENNYEEYVDTLSVFVHSYDFESIF